MRLKAKLSKRSKWCHFQYLLLAIFLTKSFLSVTFLQGEHKRKIPKFIMSVFEDLKKTSEELKKEVLNWEIVLKCVRESVKKQGIQQDLTGENVHQICSFLKDLGMVS